MLSMSVVVPEKVTTPRRRRGSIQVPLQSEKSSSALDEKVSFPPRRGSMVRPATVDDELRYRVVFLGAGKVGKSSILMRFLTGTYTGKYKETVEDLYCREYEYNGNTVKIDYLDTAGNFAFPAMRRLSISTANAFVLVFSLSDERSFAEVQQLREQIKEEREDYQEVPVVVVGNKGDIDREREVGPADVTDWIDQEGLEDCYVEVSAKFDDGVVETFQNLWDQSKFSLLPPWIHTPRKRRTSAFAVIMSPMKDGKDGKFIDSKEDNKLLARSKSLMRRGSKSKAKAATQGTDTNKLDCVIS